MKKIGAILPFPAKRPIRQAHDGRSTVRPFGPSASSGQASSGQALRRAQGKQAQDRPFGSSAVRQAHYKQAQDKQAHPKQASAYAKASARQAGQAITDRISPQRRGVRRDCVLATDPRRHTQTVRQAHGRLPPNNLLPALRAPFPCCQASKQEPASLRGSISSLRTKELHVSQ